MIQTAAALDYEVIHSHNLTIRARDPVSGSHTDAHVTVTVTDFNDNPPEFTKYIFKGEVSEAAAPGQEVLKVGQLLLLLLLLFLLQVLLLF